MSANGKRIVVATDAAHQTCRFLAVWVKHTASGRASFFFDNFVITPLQPEDPPLEYPLPERGDVVINEVQGAPAATASEFVEIYNRSNRTFDLSTLTIRDDRSSPVALTNESVEFAPGSYAVLVANSQAFADQFRTVPHIEVAPWPPLNNGGDAVIVEAAEVVDSLAYAREQMQPGRSLERIDPDGPTAPFNFAPSIDAFGATPGARNSRYERDADGPYLIFAHEEGASGLKIYFNEPIDGEHTPAAAIRLGNHTAVEVLQIAPSILRASFRSSLAATSVGSRVEVRTAVDLRGNRSDHLVLPVAFMPAPGELVLNEIMFEPLADDSDGRPDQVEYLELLNRSNRRLHLHGIFRTRDPNEHGDADTTRVEGLYDALEPNSLVLIVAGDPAGEVPHIRMTGLSLRNGGDRVRLHGRDGAVLDDLAYAPDWHHPDLIESRGIALERIDPEAEGHVRTNWTSSVSAEGGTPGRPNSVRIPRPLAVHYRGLEAQPNPFSPGRDGYEDTVRILADPTTDLARIRIRIFNLAGVEVRELTGGHLVAGETSFLWDGRDAYGLRLRTGVYIILLEVFGDDGTLREVHKKPLVLVDSPE